MPNQLNLYTQVSLDDYMNSDDFERISELGENSEFDRFDSTSNTKHLAHRRSNS